MPPREPIIDNNDLHVPNETMDKSRPPSIEKFQDEQVDKRSIVPPNRSFFHNTFHWEMNLYSLIILGFIYFGLLPESKRIYMNIIFTLIGMDASRYYYQKGSLPGCPYTLPFVSIIAMVVAPVRFWNELANIAIESGEGLCTSLLGGKFMVFATDVTLCRKIMTGEGTYQVFAHPNAFWLFDEKNLIYMPTIEHKKFRATLTPALSSHEALEDYGRTQERICREYMARFVRECKENNCPMESRIALRNMTTASSQEAFLGPYLTAEQRAGLEDDIMHFTAGFLCLPFPYLNSGLAKAIAAKHRIERAVAEVVPKAIEYIKSGKKVRCMFDRWIVSIIETAKESGIEDPTKVPYCDEGNLGRTVLGFLFAGQDATNSALTYAMDVLDAYPDVLEKIRQEVLECCSDGQSSLSDKLHQSNALSYTKKVAIQLLHHKPPVPMIPHLSLKPSVLGGYPIPSGAVVIPSIMYSARTSGASLEFLPERPDQDPQFISTVVFGGGQHKCPGRRYAESLLTIFIAILAQEYKFSRVGPRPGVDDFMYFPTVFPIDCWFNFERVPEK